MSDSAEFVQIGRGGNSQIGKVDVKVDIPVSMGDSLQCIADQLHAIQGELSALSRTDLIAAIDSLCDAIAVEKSPHTYMNNIKVDVPEVKIPPISVDISPVLTMQNHLLWLAILSPPFWVICGLIYLKFA